MCENPIEFNLGGECGWRDGYRHDQPQGFWRKSSGAVGPSKSSEGGWAGSVMKEG